MNTDAPHDLDRFVAAQSAIYADALAVLAGGQVA